MSLSFLEYYRCPEMYAKFRTPEDMHDHPGYFKVGNDIVCFGHASVGHCEEQVDSDLANIEKEILIKDGMVSLPFSPDELIENLRWERYSSHFREPGRLSHAVIRYLYYLVRPYLSVSVRKHMQRLKLRNWKNITFPEWPVDSTVDRLCRRMMALTLSANRAASIPFIWFWPNDYRGCAIITHDVESEDGRDYCGHLMDIDSSYGFCSSFQVVPENRYSVTMEYLSEIRKRGFEINVHDLKHDGLLYTERQEFLKRAAKINQYVKQFGVEGFRSGVLYRNAEWYDAFEFSYDMSIPNVGHLDPQNGGCCTIMPYFIGKVVELPLTCTQDYTLFHMLSDYSLELWKKQIDLITSNYGLVTVLVHPDYIIEERAQKSYRMLLEHLNRARDKHKLWTPLPREVASWWRQRSKMQLINENGEWRIRGDGSERARIAYAIPASDGIQYSFDKHGDKSI